jgi:hypothetical protein
VLKFHTRERIMKEDIKAQWLTALRSGEYKQGKGFLKSIIESNEPRYCCLGVLCELAEKAGVTTQDPLFKGDNTWSFDGNVSFLPAKVAAWAGIDYQGKKYETREDGARYVFVDLAELNDYRLDFAEIANVIEAEF